ncbi:hypothetical protein C8039_07575 [Halogeometricum sp. wsp3]|nr:hypothetical protein C8039_07575 [Halogeometricum sp. wsp3]
MTQLDSQAALVALGNADSQQVSLVGTDKSTYRIDDTAGRMTVNSPTIRPRSHDSHFMMSDSARSLRTREPAVAYQGGGVWRRSDGGTSWCRHRSSTTATRHSRSRSSPSGRPVAWLSVEHLEGRTTQVYRTESAENINPLIRGRSTSPSKRVLPVVGRYFEERPMAMRTTTTETTA